MLIDTNNKDNKDNILKIKVKHILITFPGVVVNKINSYGIDSREIVFDPFKF